MFLGSALYNMVVGTNEGELVYYIPKLGWKGHERKGVASLRSFDGQSCRLSVSLLADINLRGVLRSLIQDSSHIHDVSRCFLTV